MMFRPARVLWILPALLGVSLLAGCSWMNERGRDDERESHFLTGRSRASARDFTGAAEAFEQAIEVNPQSAVAHLELGVVLATQIAPAAATAPERDRNYASAIHHLARHLELDPKSRLAAAVLDRIAICKTEIARTSGYTMLPSGVQAELEKLNATNAALRQIIEKLHVQLAQQAYAHSNQWVALRAQMAASTAPAGSTAPPTRGGEPSAFQGAVASPRLESASARLAPGTRNLESTRNPTRPGNFNLSATPPRPGPIINKPSPSAGKPVAASPRSATPSAPGVIAKAYTVTASDTPTGIARQHGVSLSALLAANPGLDSRRAKAGQVIVIPKT